MRDDRRRRGVDDVGHRAAALRRADVRPWLRVALVGTLLALLPSALLVRNMPRVDRSGDYSAADFAQVTLDRLPPRAVVLTDTWSASPLWYRQLVQGQRRDVLVSPIFSVSERGCRVVRPEADGRRAQRLRRRRAADAAGRPPERLHRSARTP